MDSKRGDRLFPFSSHRKRMTALIHGSMCSGGGGGGAGGGGGQRVYSKGAAEIVLASCTHQTNASGEGGSDGLGLLLWGWMDGWMDGWSFVLCVDVEVVFVAAVGGGRGGPCLWWLVRGEEEGGPYGW